MKGEDLLKTKYYVIGNPAIRKTIKFWLRRVWDAFALIGIGNILFFIWRLFAI